MCRRFFIIAFISIGLGSQLFSQSLTETEALADKLFADQRYESAIKLYHRIIFFGADSTYPRLYPRIAECYLLTGDYNSSIFFYNLSVNSAQNDSLKTEYYLALTLSYYMLGKYDFALQTIYAADEPKCKYQRQRYHFFSGLIHLKKDEPEAAMKHFLEVVDNQEAKELIKNDFTAAKLKRPNSNVATWLSIFLPGAGQLYSGDTRNAVNSFILTGAIALLSHHIAVTYSLGDAVLSTAAWLQRYYLGGFTRAGTIATSRRIEKREQLLNRTIAVIEHYNNQ